MYTHTSICMHMYICICVYKHIAVFSCTQRICAQLLCSFSVSSHSSGNSNLILFRGPLCLPSVLVLLTEMTPPLTLKKSVCSRPCQWQHDILPTTTTGWGGARNPREVNLNPSELSWNLGGQLIFFSSCCLQREETPGAAELLTAPLPTYGHSSPEGPAEQKPALRDGKRQTDP